MNETLNTSNNFIKPIYDTSQVKSHKDTGVDFIHDLEILYTLKHNQNPDYYFVRDILDKSLAIETLTPDETATLLNVTDKKTLLEMQNVAAKVKKKVYDNRIVTFAPLYLGNYCVNNCLYCGFRKENKAIKRNVLSLEQVIKETEVLAGDIGHKRLVVVFGEHHLTDIDYITETLKTIYSVNIRGKNKYGQIRRVNVNAAPLSVEKLIQLKKSGIGTYQVFQETYHHNTYKNVHPANTIKNNYEWRLYSMHRAMEAGIDDVGIGILFGLYDWRFEVMGLLYHTRELENKFGIGPHTISFPRLEPAKDTPYIMQTKYKVNDDDFKKLITVIRLAVPYTGMILTARENAQIRRDVLPLGCTQMDASSRIDIGAYYKGNTAQDGERQQFMLGDTRSLDEVVRELAEMGNIISFCTAGYRCGRTGKKIMNYLKSGKEGKFCKVNAILTFKEWLDDFASEKTKHIGKKIIISELKEVLSEMPSFFPKLIQFYNRINAGERDLYF